MRRGGSRGAEQVFEVGHRFTMTNLFALFAGGRIRSYGRTVDLVKQIETFTLTAVSRETGELLEVKRIMKPQMPLTNQRTRTTRSRW